MSSNNKSIEILTIFRLSNMTLRLLSRFSGTNIHDQTAHASVFQALHEKLSPLTLTMIHEVDKVLDAIESVQEVNSVEISNPSNGNGFIVTFSRENL